MTDCSHTDLQYFITKFQSNNLHELLYQYYYTIIIFTQCIGTNIRTKINWHIVTKILSMFFHVSFILASA